MFNDSSFDSLATPGVLPYFRNAFTIIAVQLSHSVPPKSSLSSLFFLLRRVGPQLRLMAFSQSKRTVFLFFASPNRIFLFSFPFPFAFWVPGPVYCNKLLVLRTFRVFGICFLLKFFRLFVADYWQWTRSWESKWTLCFGESAWIWYQLRQAVYWDLGESERYWATLGFSLTTFLAIQSLIAMISSTWTHIISSLGHSRTCVRRYYRLDKVAMR